MTKDSTALQGANAVPCDLILLLLFWLFLCRRSCGSGLFSASQSICLTITSDRYSSSFSPHPDTVAGVCRFASATMASYRQSKSQLDAGLTKSQSQ
ncbi:hypothetical protein BV372_10510 [Nostoc sp. T09]|nr:hypothetical protein BV372_10510 [Nostoc sp. T09]